MNPKSQSTKKKPGIQIAHKVFIWQGQRFHVSGCKVPSFLFDMIDHLRGRSVWRKLYLWFVNVQIFLLPSHRYPKRPQFNSSIMFDTCLKALKSGFAGFWFVQMLKIMDMETRNSQSSIFSFDTIASFADPWMAWATRAHFRADFWFALAQNLRELEDSEDSEWMGAPASSLTQPLGRQKALKENSARTQVTTVWSQTDAEKYRIIIIIIAIMIIITISKKNK